MAKMIRIESCGGCLYPNKEHNTPYCMKDYDNKRWRLRTIRNMEIIQPWCPLPEAPEEKGEGNENT